MPTYVSLFSGIGGLDLAVEAHGFKCVGQVEVDAACTRVLERWWPTVPRWGDITGFGAATYASSQGRGEPRQQNGGTVRPGLEPSRRHDADRLDPPDLIIGGFPCQPVSTAGRRKAQDDHRWLWPEFARCIGELEPRWVLVENVPGLLNAGEPMGSAFGGILADLADLGYDATWTSLRAADVGACHRRQRLFLLANADDERGEPRSRWGAQGADHARPGSAQRHGDRLDGQAEPWPDAAHAGERSLAGTGSAWDGLPELAERRDGPPADADESRLHGSTEQRGRREPVTPTPFAWGAYAAAIERWERVLMRPAPHPVDEKGRLDPAFVCWMMGFPQGWTEGLSRTQALKALGNAVVPQQGAAALGQLMEVIAEDNLVLTVP